MSIHAVKHEYELLAARGHMRPEQVAIATLATLVSAGAGAFQRGYFGAEAWAKATDDVRTAKHEGEELLMETADAFATDISSATRALMAVHTTTDFPLILSQIRDRVRRQPYNPIELTPLFQAAGPTRTARDFKPLRGIRTEPFRELILRPSGTNVQYAPIESAEDGYRVANYELAVPFTWEAWVNDDIGEWTQILFNLGVAARRTRALVLLRAVRDNLTRVTPSGVFVQGTAAAGGPTPANVEWVDDRFGTAVNASGDPIDRSLTHIVVPARWRLTARRTLESDRVVVAGDTDTQVGERNVTQGLAELWIDRLMRGVFSQDPGGDRGSDWLAFDNSTPWLEFAALSGFEAGPLTYTKLPDVMEHIDQGSFDNHATAVKVGDAVGATVTDTTAVVRVAGS